MIEPTIIQNFKTNKLAAKMIAAGQDDFDLTIAQSLQAIIERIKQKRNISNRAARKVATELLGIIK